MKNLPLKKMTSSYFFLIVPLTFYTEVIKEKKKTCMYKGKGRIGSGVNSGRARSCEPCFYPQQNGGGDFGVSVVPISAIKR